MEGSAIDPEKWKKELRLRDSRNRQRGRRLQQRQRLQQPLHLAQPHNAGVLRHPLLALPPTQLYVLQCDDERILYGLLSDDIPFLFGCAWRAMVSAAAAEGALVLKV